MKGRYYLYEVSSKWNKEKERAQKISGKILGRITEDKGFTPSRGREQPVSHIMEVSAKSSSVGPFVETVIGDVLPALKKHFGSVAESIYCASLMWFVHQSSLRNMGFTLIMIFYPKFS